MPRFNTHQTHIESLVFMNGLNEIEDKLSKFIDNDDSLIETVKIDGSPAVIMWSKFDGYPDNSICLKSFVNSANNCISSVEDIKYDGDMRDKLTWCLELAKYIPEGEAWQGDCLFTHNTLREQTINGTDYLVFQPNKIIYAFTENSKNYEQIKNADLGIAFHTIYTGNIELKQQSFNVDLDRLSAPENFYLLSPKLEKIEHIDITEEFDVFENLKNQLENNKDYETLCNNELFIKFWTLYENNNYASHSTTYLDSKDLIQDLKMFIQDRLMNDYNKKLKSLKTDKAKDRAKSTYESDLLQLDEIVDTNQELILKMVQCSNQVSTIKLKMLDFYRQNNFDYDLFYDSISQGYIPAEFEGISLSTPEGDIVKLVDRSKFSFYNRNSDIRSGFLHEGLEKRAVCAFGRMNPITIGHEKLIDKMCEFTGDKLLYLSHTQNKKKDPLPYAQKFDYAQLAFGDRVKVVSSKAINMYYMLGELYRQGYTDVVYVCGGDRFTETSEGLHKYNGFETANKDCYFNFNSLEVVSAGDRSGDDLVSNVSASMAREYAKNDDFDSFKEIVPFDEEDASDLFSDVRFYLGIERLTESKGGLMSRSNIYNTLTQIIEEKSKDLVCKKYDRHNNEVARLDWKTQVNDKEQLIKKEFDRVLNEVKVIGSDMLEIPINGVTEIVADDYRFHGNDSDIDVSHSFNNYKCTFTTDNGQIVYYVTICNGARKSMIPSKTMIDDFFNEKIDYKKVCEYTDKDLLKKILNQCASNEITSITKEQLLNDSPEITLYLTDDLTKELESINNTDMFSSLKTDFSEVFGAVCLCNALHRNSKTQEVQFSKASNEKLKDYDIIIDGEVYNVSAKQNAGGKPSCGSIIEAALQSNKTDTKAYEFAKWLNDNVATKSVQEGFTNLANAYVKGDIAKEYGLKYSDDKDIVLEAYKATELDKLKEYWSFGGILNSTIRREDNSSEDNCRKLLEEIKIKIVSQKMIDMINNSPILDEINELVFDSMKQFVQVHFDDTAFAKGELKFRIKNGFNSKFTFKNNTGITRKVDNKGVVSYVMTNERMAVHLLSK